MPKTVKAMLRDVRCVFPKLFAAEEWNGKSNYSVGLLLPRESDALKTLMAAIRKAIADEYGESEVDKRIKQFAGNRTTWPIKELDDGQLQITPKRKDDKGAPTVIDRKRNNIPAGDLPYGGCWLNVSIDVYVYSKNGGGVTTYLRGVQLVREDSRLDGGVGAPASKDEFDDLSAEDESDANAGEALPDYF